MPAVARQEIDIEKNENNMTDRQRHELFVAFHQKRSRAYISEIVCQQEIVSVRLLRQTFVHSFRLCGLFNRNPTFNNIKSSTHNLYLLFNSKLLKAPINQPKLFIDITIKKKTSSDPFVNKKVRYSKSMYHLFLLSNEKSMIRQRLRNRGLSTTNLTFIFILKLFADVRCFL
jgi:hypothetical protein